MTDEHPTGVTQTADGTLLRIRVIPRARKTAIDGLLDGAIKIRLASPPVDGKANAECIAFIAHLFGLRKAEVEIVRGETSRDKVLLLHRVDAASVREALEKLVG